MYTRTIGAFEARRQFGKLITDVGYRGSSIIVEKNGEELAAIVPIELYKQWERRRKAFFASMRAVSERANVSEEEAEKLVAEAIKEVRSHKKV